jgi:hypothetical protein
MTVEKQKDRGLTLRNDRSYGRTGQMERPTYGTTGHIRNDLYIWNDRNDREAKMIGMISKTSNCKPLLQPVVSGLHAKPLVTS